jgi:hypothetical protein
LILNGATYSGKSKICRNIGCSVRLLEKYLHTSNSSEHNWTTLYRSGSLASTLNRPENIAAKMTQDYITPWHKKKRFKWIIQVFWDVTSFRLLNTFRRFEGFHSLEFENESIGVFRKVHNYRVFFFPD